MNETMTNEELSAAVAKLEGWQHECVDGQWWWTLPGRLCPSRSAPSFPTDPALWAPLIEKYQLSVCPSVLAGTEGNEKPVAWTAHEFPMAYRRSTFGSPDKNVGRAVCFGALAAAGKGVCPWSKRIDGTFQFHQGTETHAGPDHPVECPKCGDHVLVVL